MRDRPLSNEEFEEMYQVMCFLDNLLKGGRFSEADDFMQKIDFSEKTNSAWIYAVYNYTRLAEKVGDLHRLPHAMEVRQRIRARLLELVGEERTKRLLDRQG